MAGFRDKPDRETTPRITNLLDLDSLDQREEPKPDWQHQMVVASAENRDAAAESGAAKLALEASQFAVATRQIAEAQVAMVTTAASAEVQQAQLVAREAQEGAKANVQRVGQQSTGQMVVGLRMPLRYNQRGGPVSPRS